MEKEQKNKGKYKDIFIQKIQQRVMVLTDKITAIGSTNARNKPFYTRSKRYRNKK